MKKERWFCRIEFSFDVFTEPSQKRYEGDAPIDFARRAFQEGLHQRLNEAFLGNNGINWYLLNYGNNIVAKREE